MKKSVIVILLIVSMFIIAGCKEGAVGGNVGSKSSSLVKTVNKTASAVNYGDLVIGSNVLDSELYVDGSYQSVLTAGNTPYAIRGQDLAMLMF
ncbi:hypothetical protein HYT57_05670 [Candidatus Woesearchaeota archaeon]|nr:hypothetical protein [Candidatus Woesearchaeota archaeon]